MEDRVLTAEQLARIERNRQDALEKQKSRTQQKPVLKKQIRSQSYIDYDLTTIRDTQAGFMINTAVDDTSKPSSLLPKKIVYCHQDPGDDLPPCVHCCNVSDANYHKHFKLAVCPECINAKPEQYSLLTKTEIKQDYLLTDEECRDKERLPHWERPNPRKNTYAHMKLFVREQVELFAFEKWGNEDGLDAEFEKRQDVKRKRKETEQANKIADMRKRTRTSMYLDKRQKDERHVHTWIEDGDVKRCDSCQIVLDEEEI